MGCNRRLRENYILILLTKSFRTLFALLGFLAGGESSRFFHGARITRGGGGSRENQVGWPASVGDGLEKPIERETGNTSTALPSDRSWRLGEH